jgi:hypothetical protein
MNSYTMRVRVAEGVYTEVTVNAVSGGAATMIVEAQYGRGSMVGFL